MKHLVLGFLLVSASAASALVAPSQARADQSRMYACDVGLQTVSSTTTRIFLHATSEPGCRGAARIFTLRSTAPGLSVLLAQYDQLVTAAREGTHLTIEHSSAGELNFILFRAVPPQS